MAWLLNADLHTVCRVCGRFCCVSVLCGVFWFLFFVFFLSVSFSLCCVSVLAEGGAVVFFRVSRLLLLHLLVSDRTSGFGDGGGVVVVVVVVVMVVVVVVVVVWQQ